MPDESFPALFVGVQRLTNALDNIHRLASRGFVFVLS